MNESKPNVPKLRFPGFTDPWEQRKLGEIADIVSGGTPATGNPTYWDGDINWFAPAEIGDEIYVDSSRRKLTEAGYNACSTTMLPAGRTVLFTSRAGIGSTAILRSSACTNQGFQSLVVRDEASVYFVYSMTPSIKRWAEVHASGSTFLEISGKTLAGMSILIPSLDEQRAIGQFFEQFDALITLHQRKLNNLKLQKRGLLQKMFPKDGADVPELRFPGFTDPWEQRKVSELLEERNEQAPQSDDYPLMAFVANEGVAPKGERYDRSALINDAENKLYKRTRKGDFIYSSNNLETGSIGLNNLGNACISPVYSIFKPTKNVSPEFIGRSFLRKEFINKMVKYRQGVIYGQWRIHETDFLRIKTLAPSLGEQQKIGSFFCDLDALITLHQRKLDHLKLQKKALLQQMFV